MNDDKNSKMCDRKSFGINCYVLCHRYISADLSWLRRVRKERKMPRLSEAQRHEAVGMLRSMAATDVARFFNVHKSTIHRLSQRLAQSGTVSDRRRSGRPRVTSVAEDRHIRTTHLRERFTTASETSRRWNGRNNVSRYTVARRLHAFGIQSRRPAKKKHLTRQHVAARLAFARRYVRWTQQDWMNIIFSDESPYPIERQDGRRRCWRRKGERLAPG